MSGPAPDSRDADLPGWAVRLLERLVPARNRAVILGDFAEVYRYLAHSEGRARALRWFAGQVLRSLPSFLFDGVYFGGAMFSNYLKVAWRNLARRAFFSILNIGGLAVGMAACLLIFQYVAHEYSYDTFHARGDDLYRVARYGYQDGELDYTGAFTHYGLREAVREAVPGVIDAVRVHPNYGIATIAVLEGSERRNALREEHVLFADPAILDLFSFGLSL